MRPSYFVIQAGCAKQKTKNQCQTISQTFLQDLKGLQLKRPELEIEEKTSLKSFQFAESPYFCSLGGLGGRVYLIGRTSKKTFGELDT